MATAQVILLPFHLPDQRPPLLCFFFLEFYLKYSPLTLNVTCLYSAARPLIHTKFYLEVNIPFLNQGYLQKSREKNQDRYNNLNFINEVTKRVDAIYQELMKLDCELRACNWQPTGFVTTTSSCLEMKHYLSPI